VFLDRLRCLDARSRGLGAPVHAALAMDIKATVILQGNTVTLAVKGAGENIQGIGFPPPKELLASHFAQGGQILLRMPCIKGRNIAPETLVGSASLVAVRRVLLWESVFIALRVGTIVNLHLYACEMGG